MSLALLELDRLAAWPGELRTYLDAHHDLFLGWEACLVSRANQCGGMRTSRRPLIHWKASSGVSCGGGGVFGSNKRFQPVS
jgi:hypothetical protein